LSSGSAPNSALERRRERRVPVHLPMMVRGTDRLGATFEERTSSENLCRGGVAFATRYLLELGTHVEIRIPGTAAASNHESEFSTQGRIVHLKPGRTANESIVGVEFTGPRFHRIFVSESSQ
jgi:c-di-GMP-binding flagellar brake protein YcgR